MRPDKFAFWPGDLLFFNNDESLDVPRTNEVYSHDGKSLIAFRVETDDPDPETREILAEWDPVFGWFWESGEQVMLVGMLWTGDCRSKSARAGLKGA